MLNAAIVGLGWWGRVLLEAVQGQSAHLRFKSAVDIDLGAARECATRHGLELHDDYQAVLDDQDIDAVVLATPHSLHVQQIVAAAHAGKHVYSEKPLALSVVDARRAVDACTEAGVVLGLGTDKRFLPAVRELRLLVERAELGEILHVEGQYSNPNSAKGLSGPWRHSSAEAPGGGLTGPGLHALDAVVSLAGPLVAVDAQLFAKRPAPEAIDSLAALLTFESGATGVLGCVRPVPDYFRLGLFGTIGWAEVRGFETLATSLAGGQPTERHFDSSLVTGYLLDQFAIAVQGGDAFPVTLQSMLQTVAALEAVVCSLAQRRPMRVSAQMTARTA